MSILGTQLDLSAAAETALYAPAAGVQADVQVIFVNRNPSGVAKVRVVHRPGAAATQPQNYVVFDKGVPAIDERITFTFDVKNPEEVRVESDTANVSVTCNGIERPIP